MNPYDRSAYRPGYPMFSERGISPQLQQFGPPDLWPSALGPAAYHYGNTRGRYLAGVGASEEMTPKNFDSVNAEGIETYPNELDLLAAADDVQGNGVFDPNDTHGNIHPDQGVFQDHQSLPGYEARARSYQLSEVSDLTHPGGRVVYVPGGAVSLQQGQQETLTENQLLWKLPRDFDPMPTQNISRQSIVDAPTPTYPISSVGIYGLSNYNPYYLMAGIGLVAGLAYCFWPKKGRR